MTTQDRDAYEQRIKTLKDDAITLDSGLALMRKEMAALRRELDQANAELLRRGPVMTT